MSEVRSTAFDLPAAAAVVNIGDDVSVSNIIRCIGLQQLIFFVGLFSVVGWKHATPLLFVFNGWVDVYCLPPVFVCVL